MSHGVQALALLPTRPLALEVTAASDNWHCWGGGSQQLGCQLRPPAVSESRAPGHSPEAHGFLALLLFFWSLVCTTLSVVRKLPRKRTRNVSANTNTWWDPHQRGKGERLCQL